jgi:hypothetical protein
LVGRQHGHGRLSTVWPAQTIKRDSDQIVDSIVTDDIGKLPDRSVTEVLQRVVGVTIDRTMTSSDPGNYAVEGSGGRIRGLSYVRSLNFDDVLPVLMAGVGIYKNPSASVPTTLRARSTIRSMRCCRNWPMASRCFTWISARRSWRRMAPCRRRRSRTCCIRMMRDTSVGKSGAAGDRPADELTPIWIVPGIDTREKIGYGRSSNRVMNTLKNRA